MPRGNVCPSNSVTGPPVAPPPPTAASELLPPLPLDSNDSPLQCGRKTTLISAAVHVAHLPNVSPNTSFDLRRDCGELQSPVFEFEPTLLLGQPRLQAEFVATVRAALAAFGHCAPAASLRPARPRARSCSAATWCALHTLM